MCLILFSWNVHPVYKLIVAANRDEFYARPTSEASFWQDHPSVLAGRDLKAGGTWLGLDKAGYFAAITNYRDVENIKTPAASRGDLTKNFLLKGQAPADYMHKIVQSKDAYNGYNLLVSDLQTLCYYSNQEQKIRTLFGGVYGLSNHLLDTNWPKVAAGKAGFTEITRDENVATERLFQLLKTTDIAADVLLPKTGVGLDWERALSPIFINTGDYGTYCSTVILVKYDGTCDFVERTYKNLPDYKEQKFDLKLKM